MQISINSLTTLPEATLGGFGKILLTGATGRVGIPLTQRLAELGFRVKAATPDKPLEHPNVEWVRLDFMESLDFTEALQGVTHVLHLGAELWDTDRMERINSTATEALVAAAEAAGVQYFCYTSSICTYGSPRTRRVTEETPLMPSENATTSDYAESHLLIEYGRTKLLGELKIQKHAKRAAYVTLRPTEITWENQMLRTLTWSLFTRMWRGYRHCHQVYYRDVINTIIFFLLRSNDPAEKGPPGVIEVYNVTNDEAPNNTFGDFMRLGYRETGDKRFWLPVLFPGWFDYIKDRIKFKAFGLRYPFGMIYAEPTKLYATGYRHEYGLAEAQRSAIALYKQGGF